MAKVIKDSTAAAEMQTIIGNLERWCNKWEMKFNTDKCSIMHLGRQNSKTTYKMNGQTLSTLQNQKDLGVTITDNCQPSEQCAKAAKKAYQVMGQINRSFSCYTKDVMLQISILIHFYRGIRKW